MRAVEILTPDKLTGRLALTDIPAPVPKPHEVLIKIAYAGLNRADVFQRMGMYPAPEGASPIPGLEAAGEIIALGEKVTQWRVGDKVCALLSGGGYAEYAVAHADYLLPVPSGWSIEEAAGLPEALFTVWMALHDAAHLQKGEAVLIHGGASGVGMMAIQYAAAKGATVFATAGTAEKCAACTQWGAAHAILHTTEDFVAIIDQHTQGRGVDVVLDMVGGDYIVRNFKAMAIHGRMVTIAYLRGSRPEGINLSPMLLKNLSWQGATLRHRSDDVKARYAQEIRREIWLLLESGRIKPRIDRVFSLENAQKAHHYMEENLNIGKILLQV